MVRREWRTYPEVWRQFEGCEKDETGLATTESGNCPSWTVLHMMTPLGLLRPIKQENEAENAGPGTDLGNTTSECSST